MAYQVPKFIEEETKLMGLITFNQLWLLLSFIILIIILFNLLQTWLWFIISVVLVPFGLFVTFGTVYNLPVYSFFMSAIRHFWLPKYYLWQKEKVVSKAPKDKPQKITSSKETSSTKNLDKKTLQKLTEILDK
jgi:hypothetical protein